jgi:hypothetical protein
MEGGVNYGRRAGKAAKESLWAAFFGMPFVFSAVLNMRLWQIPLYPFTVGLPAIVRLLRMGI